MSWRCSPRTRIRPLWRKGCGSAFSRGSGRPPRSGSPRTCSRRSRSLPGCSTRATSCRISCSWACCCRCGAEPVAQTPGSTPTASRTALVAGASGLVGSRVLRLLLEDAAYARVTVLARRELPLSHKKLEQRVVSFDRLAQLAAWAFVGPLARYRPIKAETVARAMVRVAREAPRGTHVYESQDIRRRAAKP